MNRPRATTLDLRIRWAKPSVSVTTAIRWSEWSEIRAITGSRKSLAGSLGARPGSVVRLMLRGLALPLTVGIALGLIGSLAAGRLVGSLLYGVRSNDPAQLIAASLILVAAATLAGYLPARRAARLHPMIALRD
jgi:hypothetical protein